MKRIKLEKIEYDPKYYPRVNGKEDWMTVLQYMEAVKTDARLADPKAYPPDATGRKFGAFPPVVVVPVPGKPGWYMLLDGLHRVKAFTSAGLDHIYAEIEDLPKSKWFVRSVELNVRPARGFDSGDKAFIAQRLKADGWKIDKIAGLLKMRIQSLEKLVITRCQKLKITEAKILPVGRGNRKINGASYGFLKAPFAELANTSKGKIALQRQQSVSSQTVLQVLDAAIAVIESGAADLSDDAVAERIKQLTDLLAVTA